LVTVIDERRQKISILSVATKGSGTNDERRLQMLLRQHSATFVKYDKSEKLLSLVRLCRILWRERPDLFVMEGTGVAGGAACLMARAVWGQRYVVSSGDAVGPFVGNIRPSLRPMFALYERALYRYAAGFVGWTPYLTGRALTFGVPRAMTAPGWSEQAEPSDGARRRIRKDLGIPDEAIVFGLVGSLVWNRRFQYCYGLELVRAVQTVNRPNVCVLVVGGGSGLPELRGIAGACLGSKVFLPGPVSSDQVVDYMAAMDVGSLPQSLDGVGMFRYTTKICEYLAAGLPIVTGEIPMAYDLGDDSWVWRLPGPTPWSGRYILALAQLMDSMSFDKVTESRAAVPKRLSTFDPERQVRAASAFFSDLLSDSKL
jgi:glycosyltransferase involved in cell wall biosynthesis